MVKLKELQQFHMKKLSRKKSKNSFKKASEDWLNWINKNKKI